MPEGRTTTTRRIDYTTVSFLEPDGRQTWAVRERTWDDLGYFRRQLVSFHPTREDAGNAVAVAYQKAASMFDGGHGSTLRCPL